MTTGGYPTLVFNFVSTIHPAFSDPSNSAGLRRWMGSKAAQLILKVGAVGQCVGLYTFPLEGLNQTVITSSVFHHVVAMSGRLSYLRCRLTSTMVREWSPMR